MDSWPPSHRDCEETAENYGIFTAEVAELSENCAKAL